MQKRIISILLLLAYTGVLIQVMVFKDIPLIKVGQLMLNFGGTNAGTEANFIPFSTILPYLLGSNGLLIGGINLVGNIVLLVPLGFLAPFAYRNMTWKKSIVLGILAGLTIEVMQTILKVGIFDIDDVILNALGVVLGYGIFAILTKWVRERKYVTVIVSALLVISIPMTVLYAIYPHDEPINPDVRVMEGADLCGGTGGTGKIISAESEAITIELNDESVRAIKLTKQTDIRSSSGSISESDLKNGDRVTLVIDESETAAVVLVCDGSGA